MIKLTKTLNLKQLFLLLFLFSGCFISTACSDDPAADEEQTDGKGDNDGKDDGEDGDQKEPDGGGEEDTAPPLQVGKVELDKLYGYGENTTGGENATASQTFHFDDGKAFTTWLNARQKKKDTTPAIVYLSGTFTKDDGRASGSPWFDIKDTKNLSIYGTKDFVMENVGIFIVRCENIIIRNLYIKMPKADNGADGISMQESNNIWVDHCTFESINQTKDYEDGSCDITHHSYNVTVSWCHFIKTQKSCLVGHSDGASEDEKITVTFHHNYFDKSSSRHPRVRYGRAHVYNNFFDGCTTYGVGSAYGAKVLVENNYFDAVVLPIDICTYKTKDNGKSNLTGKVAGYVYERGNEYANRPEKAKDPYPLTNLEYKVADGEKLDKPLTFDDFKPSYSYIVDEVKDVPSIVKSASGAGKLSKYDTAPIPVNNGNVSPPPTPDPDPEKPDPDPDKPDAGGSILGNGWMYVSNNATTAGNPVTSGNTVTLTSSGKFESGAQGFGCIYRESTVDGDFTITVQLDVFDGHKGTKQGLAGLFVTTNPNSSGTDLLYVMTAKGGEGNFYRMSRETVSAKAGSSAINAPAATGGATVLKLERKGEKCYFSYSLDGGATYSSAKNAVLSGTVYIGLAVNSGDAKQAATAKFSNFSLNGSAISF